MPQPEAGGLSYNRAMHRLRCSRWLTWALLAAFTLLTAAAGAAPLLRPVAAFERLCSANGPGRLVPAGFDGPAQPATPHVADCALCVPASAPPPVACSVPIVHADFSAPRGALAPAWRVTQRNGLPPVRAPPVV